MQTAFRIAYSLVVAILFVLFVVLGIRTFYAEPEAPHFSPKISPGLAMIFCEPEGRCFISDGPDRREISPDDPSLTEDQRSFLREQQEYYQKQSAYEDERPDYHRNVFIIATVLGVLAVSAGLYLFRRVEAVPFGLLMGGIGVITYGWAQAAGDFDQIGEAPLFVMVTIGLVAILAAGHFFLGGRENSPAG